MHPSCSAALMALASRPNPAPQFAPHSNRLCRYVPLGTMLFDRLLAAAHEQMTTSLLSLVMDTSVLVGTASLLCYKDFVQEHGSEDAAHMYSFFCASCWDCGVAIFVLLLAANWSLGAAVDKRQRTSGKLDAACSL